MDLYPLTLIYMFYELGSLYLDPFVSGPFLYFTVLNSRRMPCRLRMIHKRPFVDNESYEFACKHPRQLDCIDQLTSNFPLDDAYQKTRNSGEDSLNKYQELGRPRSDSVMEVSNEAQRDVDACATGCFPHFLWVNDEALQEDNLSLFPECLDNGEHLKAFLHSDDILSPIDCPFHKPVSIGVEHQAEIPEWNSADMDSSKHLSESTSQGSLTQSFSLRFTDSDGYEDRLMGTCVVPMPQLEVSASSYFEGANSECMCLDRGSIRCVRQHIVEARQKLIEDLGEQTFRALGFCEMGDEEIANRWAEDEQQAFYEVVMSNPVSLGKNFWNHLSATFPSRSKSELVSFYFNVFVLQKRAEQNRFHTPNVDSDDDEWQRGEDGVEEEEDDSVVESLTVYGAPCYEQDQRYGCYEHIEDEGEVTASKEATDYDSNRVVSDEEYDGDLDDISGNDFAISSRDYSSRNNDKKLIEFPANKEDDDSCTSYEYQQDNADPCLPLDSVTDGRHSNQQ
ncbi:hypothetical protein K2173_020250 [Erythroxylum novogranatense]|uniref:Myb-like domain-containing protein n=1 Tax=Erythroxylum novogranatense TaxID=1862640 RepID=A0AAV8U8N6_9ROSI|nr:hypothetical protein K2173_020250 [Erythroxylum novogranatense]